MCNTNRDIHELLIDYAAGLRDGCLPAFLKSLTREEADLIGSSADFWEATEVVRVLNEVGFADKVVTPNVGLFISRVDASIGSRMKNAHASTRTRRRSGASGKSQKRTQETI